MKYIETVPIEAEQFDGSQIMANKYDINLLPKSLNIGLLPTLEGSLKLRTGDWIATGAMGEHWPVADEVFKQTYQQLPVISMSVDCFITWCKGQNTPLRDALYFESNGFMYSEQDEERIGGWIADHQDEFARAWLDGYEIDNKS